MAIELSVAAPRLGDPCRVFRQRFGPPLGVVTAEDRRVQWYASSLGSMEAMFSHRQSIALRLPYPTAALTRAKLEAAVARVAPAGGGGYRLWLGDDGWIIANTDCPHKWIDELGALVRD